ncbi:right-handed parallel beta-helix repeat-containing protein [Natronorubrum tibetense]|uniref:right-handed parallel beta-helix repeat-containing protein n=1 Tax=Natronorubrum tibetense TaxID=63128 RepID=UPI0003809631|nr:right-handed parallel beta-helix repeat-containing protein [Natronorubrum tibetense]
MVTSIAAPVGAVGASGVADDGGLADGMEGLSPDLGGEGANLLSTDGDNGEEVADPEEDDEVAESDADDEATDESDESEEDDGAEDEPEEDDEKADESGDSSDFDQVQTTSTSSLSCEQTVDAGESIQSAIYDAEWGDTICVGSGTYEEDLRFDSGGITLVADGDVTLAPEDETFTGVFVNASSVTVEGFDVREFSRGIHVASDTSSVEIRDNNVTANDDGVHLAGVTGTVIDGNTFTANAENGIVFHEYSSHEAIEITNNTITDNEYHAIRAIGERVGNGASGTLVSGNTISNNTGTDSSPAISFRQSSDTTVVDNDIQHDGQIAIDIRDYSSDALIERNTITNTSRGIHLGDASSIEIRDNDIEGLSASAIWMRASDEVEIVDNRLDGNGQGISSGGDTLLVENNTISSDGSDLSLSSTTDATVRDNEFAHGVTMSSGTNEQELDHFRHEFDDNTVGGDDLVYVRDADGVTITPSSYPDAGQLIVANSTDVEISDFELGGTVAAIQLGVTEGTIVANNTVSDGIEGGKGGIIDMGSTGSLIEHNDVSTVQYGVQLVGGSDSIVRDNTVSDTVGTDQAYTFGIHLERHGENHVVRDNTVTGSYSDGIHVAQSTDGTLVEGNTLENNDRHGLQIRWNAEDSVVRDNEISGNSDDGIYLERADRTVVEGNDVSENTQGIAAGRDTVDLWIEDNTITDNSLQGIQLEPPGAFTSGDAPYNATILDNEIADNARDGILLDEAAAATVVGNAITNNGHVDPTYSYITYGNGIGLSDAINATVERNTIEESVVDGIDVGAGSGNAMLSNNTVTHSGDRGIHVDAENATLRHNSIVDNPEGLESSGVEVDARLNWWGAESGPSGGVSDPDTGATASGSGDSVSADVRFDPWTKTDPADDAPHFAVSVAETNSPVTAGEPLEVDVTVENTGTEAGTQTISLEAFDGSTVDELEELSLDPDENHTATLTWETETDDASSGDVTVRSEDDDVTASVSVDQDEPVTITESTVISAPGTYLLDANLTDDTTAIEITSSDVVFDGQGHTITGIDDASDGWEYGVYVNGSAETLTNVTVRDVTVTEWRQGVRYSGANDGTVSDVVAEYNSGGFVIRDASNNAFTNLTARHNDNTGISAGSTIGDVTLHNSFTNVTAHDNGDVGINMAGDSNDIVGANVSSNHVGIETWGTGNTFIDATVDDNSQYGLNLESSGTAGNTFETVNVSGNGWHDIRVGSDGNTLTNVTASGEHGTAIYLVGDLSGGPAASHNTFESLTVTDTDEDAIGLSNADHNEFTDVTYADSDGRAVSVTSRSENNEFTDVTVTGGAASAVYLAPSDNYDNTFTNVQVTGAQGGLSIYGDGTTVTDLTVEDVAGTGISVSSSATDSVVSGVTISNTTTGVAMTGTPTNNSLSDVVIDGADTGLSVAGPDNALSNVTVTDTDTGVSVGESATTDFETITLEETTISFAAQNVEIDSATEPDDLPAEVSPFDMYANVSEAGDDPQLEYLRFHYDDSDVFDIDESTLEIWQFDGTWNSPADGSYDSGVNATEQYVYAENVTEFATFGVFNDGLQPVSDVTDVSLNTDEVAEGDNVTVSATVENVGEEGGTLSIPLEIDGDVVDTKTVDLGPGEITEIEFTHAFDEVGTFDVRVGGSDAGEVIVHEGPDISVFGASTDRTELSEDGETVTVTGDLYNAGAEGEHTVRLLADGEVVDETDVTVGPGIERDGVELSWTPSSEEFPPAGEHTDVTLTLDGLLVETVTLEYTYSDIDVIAASVSDDEIVEGENASVIGSIYQAGNVNDPEEIELTATNTETGQTDVVGTQEVSLEPGFYHLGAINITHTFNEAGNYTLELGDRPAGSIEVEAAESDIQVIAASASEHEIVAGEEFHVIGSLYQGGNIDGPEDVTLNATPEDGNGDPIELGVAEDIELSPGFYHLGAINITAEFEDDQAGNYTLELGDRPAGSIEVEAAESDIQVIAASASEHEVVAGEEFHVIGSLYQGGNIDGPEDVTLNATPEDGNGEAIELGVAEDIEIAPGFYHLGAINITAEFEDDQAGNYTLELGDRPAGSIEVEAAESDIQVIAASASEHEIVAGEEFHVIGSIYQGGNVDGPEDITLNATPEDGNGEAIELGVAEDVELSPGFYHLGAINITAEFEDDQAGNYTLELGDRPAGSIEVEAAESDIQVIAASASEHEIVAGEEFHVIGSLYQGGNIEGPEDVTLNATPEDGNGDPIELGVAEDIEIAPGFYHLGAINITAEFEDDQAGNYTLELGDRPAGSIEVEAAESDIQVIAASVTEMNVTTGENFSVVGSLYQGGNVDGPEDITLNATPTDSDELIELGVAEDVEIAPGFYHLGAINITAELDEPGTYDLTLGDYNVGTIGVEESPSDIDVIAASLSEIEVLEDEELYIIGSIYQAGESGTEEIELEATDQDTGDLIELGSQEVELDSGVYHLGAINISFSIDEPGRYDLTLGGQDAGELEVLEATSDIDVIAASASESEIVEGEEFHVVGSLYQGGTIEGPEDVALNATPEDGNGDPIELGVAEDIELAPGFYHLGAVNITAAIDEPGNYTLELGDRPAGSIEVEAAESDIQVIAASASEHEVVEGEEFHVIGSLYQGGNIDGPEDVTLNATPEDGNGDPIELGVAENIELSPGFYHLGAINITAAIDAPGTYALELGDRPAGSIEVEAAESDIQVIAASASESEIVEGEEFHVIGSLYQGGTIEGPEDVALNATPEDGNGDPIELGVAEDIELAPGFYHLGAVNITAAIDEPGNYTLELGDRPAGFIEVEAAESDIQVVAASASESEIVEGEEFHVIGSIYQGGTIDGPEDIALNATPTDGGETIELGVAGDVELSPGFYHLGAINITAEFDESGTYDLELGDRTAGVIAVEEPVVEPEIVDVQGHSTVVDPRTGGDFVYASEDATVEVDVDSNLEIDEVTVLVTSLETTYSVSTEASHAGGTTWSADVPIADLVDDGRYALSVVAVDERDNGGADDAAETLVIDREEPSMSVTIEDVDNEDATVVVESDAPLADVPDVSADFVDSDDGSTEPADVTMETAADNDTRFTGTLEFDETGNYTVTAAGTDLAGNEGEDTASVVVNTGFTLGDGEIVLDETGTSVAFDVADDAEQAIKTQELFLALSENSVNANLDGGQVGVGFLTAELDSFIDHHLEQGTIEGATISMAIDEDELASGVGADDVVLHHYDEPAGEWNAVDSTVTTIGSDPFVTADVTGFSTYGALVIDEKPPEIQVAESPDGDTVRFTYDDDLSGIDLGSVAISVDGTDVTNDDGTSITSSGAEHSFDADPGESFSVTISVADEAGNDATATTSFTLEDDADSSPSPGPFPSPSPDPDDGTDEDEGDADDNGDADEDDSDNGDTDSKKDADDADDDDTGETDDADDADDTDSTDGEMDDGDAGDDESTGESDDSIPGFGLVIALVALLSIALFRTRSLRS